MEHEAETPQAKYIVLDYLQAASLIVIRKCNGNIESSRSASVEQARFEAESMEEARLALWIQQEVSESTPGPAAISMNRTS